MDEPRTMARVQALADERWPRRAATFWITPGEPRRHAAVRFGRDVVEGTGRTWLEAFDAVDAQRRRSRRGEAR